MCEVMKACMLSDAETRAVLMRTTSASSEESSQSTPDYTKNNLNVAHQDNLTQRIKRLKPQLPWSPSLRRIASMASFTASKQIKTAKTAKTNNVALYKSDKTIDNTDNSTMDKGTLRGPVSNGSSSRPSSSNIDSAFQSFRTETMTDRLALMLSHALMPREGHTPIDNPTGATNTNTANSKLTDTTHTIDTPNTTPDALDENRHAPYTPHELQTMFVFLQEVVYKLTTILRFESDEMATTIMLAERLRKIKCDVPTESVRIVAYTCAVMASKHCNDDGYNVDAFAQLLHLKKETLLRFERVLFDVLWKHDVFVVNTSMVKEAVERIENVDLDYTDVTTKDEVCPIWPIGRVQEWKKYMTRLKSAPKTADFDMYEHEGCTSPMGLNGRSFDQLSDEMDTSPQTAPTTPVRIVDDDFALPAALKPQVAGARRPDSFGQVGQVGQVGLGETSRRWSGSGGIQSVRSHSRIFRVSMVEPVPAPILHSRSVELS